MTQISIVIFAAGPICNTRSLARYGAGRPGLSLEPENGGHLHNGVLYYSVVVGEEMSRCKISP